jgi:hypothetical protein
MIGYEVMLKQLRQLSSSIYSCDVFHRMFFFSQSFTVFSVNSKSVKWNLSNS